MSRHSAASSSASSASIDSFVEVLPSVDPPSPATVPKAAKAKASSSDPFARGWSDDDDSDQCEDDVTSPFVSHTRPASPHAPQPSETAAPAAPAAPAAVAAVAASPSSFTPSDVPACASSSPVAVDGTAPALTPPEPRTPESVPEAMAAPHVPSTPPAKTNAADVHISQPLSFSSLLFGTPAEQSQWDADLTEVLGKIAFALLILFLVMCVLRLVYTIDVSLFVAAATLTPPRRVLPTHTLLAWAAPIVKFFVRALVLFAVVFVNAVVLRCVWMSRARLYAMANAVRDPLFRLLIGDMSAQRFAQRIRHGLGVTCRCDGLLKMCLCAVPWMGLVWAVLWWVPVIF